MIIFDIENKQEEYALCHSIINFCKTGMNFDKIFDVSACDKFVLRYINSRLEADNYEHNKKIIKVIEKGFNEVKPATVSKHGEPLSLFSDLERNANYVRLTTVSSCEELLSWFTSLGLNADDLKCEMFLFRVKNTNEDDCVNFSYFELIRQYYNDCFVYIIPRDVSDVFRISRFYFIENLVNNRSAYNHRYFLNTGKKQIQHLNVEINMEGGVNYAASFMPLIEINDCTYDILSDSLNEIFTLDNFLSNFGEVEKLLSMEKQWVTDVLNQKKSDNEIYTYRIKMFLVYLFSLVYEFCDWSNIKDSIENTSVLSFVFFLTFVNSIKNKDNKLETYLLRDLLFDAENFSEGILQLIENALLYSKHGRYFCYRIHDITDKNGPEKFKEQGVVSDMGHCLEVLISDYNVCRDTGYTSIIKERFIEILENNDVEMDIIHGFKKHLAVKDFFEPSEKANEYWEKYYSKPENVVFHYGLNIFDQVVASSKGYFMMSSSNDGISFKDSRYERFIDEADSNKRKHKNIPVIPGTMYRILLPLNRKNHADFTTGINSDLNFELIEKRKIETKTIIVRQIVDKINSCQQIDQSDENRLNKKNNEIRKIADLFGDKILNDNAKLTVLILDTKGINLPMESEKFSKALVSMLVKIGKITKRIAVINATDTLRSVFIRTVGTLYYKDRQRSFLKDIQIFLCDEKGQKGIIFYGEEIEDSIAATQFLFDEKGEYLYELHKLENIKRRKGGTKKVKSNITDIFPFDVIVKDGKNDKTIFQEKVIDDINRDITKRQFGCKLENVHMRVGSKIHIHGAYFEASLLFSISNYVSRFAYLLAEDIYSKYNQSCNGKKLILVGYDTYSEMLMVKIVEILKDRFLVRNCNYCIYEEAAKSEKFRNLDKVSVEDVKFVVVIPIGSSLTTNQKVVKELGREVKGFNVNNNILSNHCVVLIRDKKGEEDECSEIEKDFWSKFDTSLSEVTLKEDSEDDVKGYNISNDNKVKFIVCVSHEWFRQDDCIYCYPVKLINENPIIQVNKSSVIPLIKIGLSEEWDDQPKDEMELSSKNKKGDVKLLKDYVIYGHLSRDDNHFEYYPQTEKLMQYINDNESSENEFDDWAKAVGEDIRNKLYEKRKTKNMTEDEMAIYDFIVAPIHATNTLFIEKINKKALNAKAIIWIDASSEYRDNVKTKYSFLTSLFNNLTQEGKNAQINFHFVDDTITSGFHISRSKSLLYSLFIKEAFSGTGYKGVKVNLFASVIILVNRISEESKQRYIDDTNWFFDYIDLNISALRNHADACILCNKFKGYREMLTFSGTNDLAKVFSGKMGKYENKPIDTLIKDSHPTNGNTNYSKNDGFLRMLYNHELNSEMGSKKHLKNNKEEVLKILKNKLTKIIEPEETRENEISDVKKVRNFLYVIATPFFIFRKSALEASFEFMLNLTEWVILRGEKNGDFFDDSVGQFIENMESEDEKSALSEFLKTLFHRLSILGSNFVIRAKVINAFFAYISEHSLQDKQTEWIKFYVSVIKQTLYFNKQDSRSLWLEKLLIDRKEPIGNKDALIIDNEKGIDNFRCLALLENNTIIHDALQETQRVFENAYGKKIDEDTRVDDLLHELCQLDDENDNMTIKKSKWTEIQNGICEELNSYYCKHYREMLYGNNASVLVKNEDPKIKTVAHMTFLKVLLIPKHNLFGNQKKNDRFYRILLKTIGEVFGGCKKIRLFEKITLGGEINIHFIDSSVDGEDRARIKNKKIYREIEELLKKDSPAKLGNTIFVHGKFCVIQLDPPNNSLKAIVDKEQSNGNYVMLGWYFVFEMDNNVELTDEILKHARDLLVMREPLVTRFERDFDNHLYQQWVDLDKQVAELSIESAGSHRPYEELEKEYDEMLKEIKHFEPGNEDSFAKRLFLMADSYISKWYVNKTIEYIPEQIDKKRTDIVPLKLLKLFLEKAQFIELAKLDAKPASIKFINFDNDTDAMIPNKCEPFFIMMFVVLFTNAMRHGICRKAEKTVEVKLELTDDKKHLEFSNRAEEGADCRDTADKGITLKTIKWFYDKFGYPPVISCYDKKDGFLIYCIKIPIVKGG